MILMWRWLNMKIVTILNRAYKMNDKQALEMIEETKGFVGTFGIYALEKENHIQLMNVKCKSITQLKAKIRTYKSEGYKVYYNGL